MKRNRPWFNDKCKEAIGLRRKALREFEKEQQKTYKNLNNSKQKFGKQKKINKKAGKIILANLVQQQKQNPYGT